VCVSGERAWCLRRVILGEGDCCNECGSSGFFIIESAQWTMTSPPRLEVASKRVNCGTGATTSLSLQEAGRCGFDDPD
jgi:hypothetical protein